MRRRASSPSGIGRSLPRDCSGLEALRLRIAAELQAFKVVARDAVPGLGRLLV
jgi:hypothetical protein